MSLKIRDTLHLFSAQISYLPETVTSINLLILQEERLLKKLLPLMEFSICVCLGCEIIALRGWQPAVRNTESWVVSSILSIVQCNYFNLEEKVEIK